MTRTLIALSLSVALVGCGPTTGTLGQGNGSGGSTMNGGSGGTGGTGGTGGSGGTGGTGGTGTGGSGTGGSGTGGSGSGGTGTGGTGSAVLVAGSYDVTTQFNLLDALPPDVSNALGLVLSFADSPGQFLLDQAGKLPVIKYVIDAVNLFSGVHDKIVMGIDEYINDWSGGMVMSMHQIASNIEMALRGLKAHNRLTLQTPDASGKLALQDLLVDLTFTYNGQDYAYAQNAQAMTTAQLSGLKLTIAQHSYDHGLNIGSILVDLVDNVALPQLTGVDSLGALLNQLVNCGGVGSWVWSYIGNICLTSDTSTCIWQYISANDISKLCVNALDAAGNAIEDKLASLDAPGMMSLSDGNSLILEQKGATGHADTIMGGTWSLTLPIGVGNITLPGAFTGTYATP